MLTDDRLMAEIRDANLSYLILAQSLIRKALYRLGISEETAALVEQLSPAQLLRIAQGNMLVCRFRFDDEMMWSLLADHGGPDEREDRSASRLHAAILMAGNFQETLEEPVQRQGSAN